MEKSPRPLSGQETSVPSQVESNSDNDSLNPVGNLTEKDKAILKEKGLTEEEYCQMWELPPLEDPVSIDINEARQKCLAEYDE